MATMIHGPLTIDPAHPIVESAQRALSGMGRQGDSLTVFPAWTDGALLSREGKIPTIIWGPGELSHAHSPEEKIKLEEVHSASELYTAAALDFSGTR
jgi:acetylornithine deacetylase/succinyl-diaminopimelate desuccinylase-like protein